MGGEEEGQVWLSKNENTKKRIFIRKISLLRRGFMQRDGVCGGGRGQGVVGWLF